MTNKLLIGIVIALGVLWWAASVYGWEKDKGASCERVFASITNEEDTLTYDGFVKANGTEVASISGTAAPHEVVTVEWATTPGFTGTVEARVRLLNGRQVADSSSVREVLACEVTVTPEVTPEASPTATLTPTPTVEVTPTQGPTSTPGPGPTATPGPAKEEPKPTPTLTYEKCTPTTCGMK